MNTRKRLLSIALAAVSLGFFCAGPPAFGHEQRAVGNFNVEVGWHLEPSFRGFPNAFEIIVTRAADGLPLNVKKGDVVDLTVEVQLRERENADSRILQSAKLQQPLRQSDDVPNQYNISFLPTVVGTYAFHITGTIGDLSDPDGSPMKVDMTFVCGKGSRDATTDFDCVVAPQLFPSGQ